MSVHLVQKHCVPCEGGTPPLKKDEAEILLQQLNGWSVASDAKSIHKAYKFENWKQAHEFVNKISDIAEKEGHHPDIALRWGSVGVTLMTHAIGGLSENDFILATKIDRI
ncbi:MAG: 4a-hydroxytetrahydrobiopterin dehydratase [Patescibacteria group bacterium]